MAYLQNSSCWNELKNDPERVQQLIDSVETHLRGISKEQTCILTCKDRGNHLYMSPACIGRMDTNDVKKHLKGKCLRLEGSNFRLGGIAPITRAVPSFRVPMRLAVSVV